MHKAGSFLLYNILSYLSARVFSVNANLSAFACRGGEL